MLHRTTMILLAKRICFKEKFGIQQMMKYSSKSDFKTELKDFEDIPGPLSIPHFGTSWLFSPIIGEFDHMHLDEVTLELFKRYGPIVRQTVGHRPLVHLFYPDDFQTVCNQLLKNPLNHIKSSFDSLRKYKYKRPHLYPTTGLLAGNGEPWWDDRKNSQKYVSSIKSARDFLGPNDEITKEFVTLLGNMGYIDDYLSLAYKLNLELTFMMLYDERYYCFDNNGILPDSFQTKIINHIINIAETMGYFDRVDAYWTNPTTQEYEHIWKVMENMEKLVLYQIEMLKRGNNFDTNKGVVAQLLKDSNFDNQHLLSSITDILYAGLDTTANTSTFLFYNISRDERIQDLLIREAVRLLPKGRESPITNDVLNNANYLKSVLKENFRLFPIVTTHKRELTSNLELAGYNVPQGTLVALEVSAACKLEENVKEPFKFIPERWLKGSEKCEKIHPYLSLPFGLGVRTCLARRRAEQILLVLMLRVFSEYQVKNLGGEIGTITTFATRPDTPLKILFTKHNLIDKD